MDIKLKNSVTGHVEIKKGYWHMVFNHGFDESGKRRRWSKTTRLPFKGNKRKAESILRTTLESFNNSYAEGLIDFYQLIEKWLIYVSVVVAENTLLKYQYAAKHLINYYKGKGMIIQDLLPSDIADYYLYKLQSKNRLSANTLLTHRTVMIGSLQYAIEYLGIEIDNAALKAKPPKKEDYIPSFYNETQINEVFQHVQDDIIAPAVYLTASYGLRRSEVLGIKWDAIDFDRKTITIRHTITKIGKRDVARDRTKSKAGLRTLALTDGTEKYLTNLYSRLQKDIESGELANKYICCRDNGDLLRPDYITRRWKRFLEIQELPHIRFHDLRHSAASVMIDQGLSLVEVQSWLGHAKLESTLVYVHLYKHSNRKIANKIDSVLRIPG